ncbi:MAG: DUF1223 domain-containing protein [Erythrobacter sp.]|nr:DUF1223 domain-containing protein [Erythrobacter sp.]
MRATLSLHPFLLLAIVLAVASLATPKPGFAQAENGDLTEEPVLLELFTSQGCSSCPPADRLAAKLDREGDFIVISRPVDYWDRLGWKDTFASPANTALQRTYARRGLAGYNGVYTPQTVVDGLLGEVGSSESAIRRLAREASRVKRAAIRIRKRDDGGFGVGLGGTTERLAELVLLGVARSETVAIGRGENGGRRITYTNVLIGEERLADWNGGKASHRINQGALGMHGADRYAVVLREPNGGRVLSARWLD